MSPLRIAVLLGGTSEERRVSIASGRAVVAALRGRGHRVSVVDPALGAVPAAREAEWLGGEVGARPPEPEELAAARAAAPGAALATLPEVAGADVVFVALHGGNGENGRLQASLDLAGVRYTGSGHLGCALAFDKRVSKELLRAAGVPTPEWAPAALRPADAAAELGLPVVVKPAGGGSTVGLTVVRRAEELDDAVRLASRYDADVLIEGFVPGRELTVAVLEDEALPPVEIRPKHEIYDYESKYTPGMSEYDAPAELPPDELRRLRELALRAHRVLRQGSFGRVDFRRDGRDGSFQCLEANSVPGLTATSLVPKAAAAAGIAFPELCERIVRAALRGPTPGTDPGRAGS